MTISEQSVDVVELDGQPSIGELVQDVTKNLSTIIRGEIELAKLELRGSVKSGGVGTVLIVASLVVLALALPFVFITIAEILIAVGLPRWSGYAIVTAFFFLISILLLIVGIKKVKKVKGPAQTIATGKETAAYLKSARQKG